VCKLKIQNPLNLQSEEIIVPWNPRDATRRWHTSFLFYSWKPWPKVENGIPIVSCRKRSCLMLTNNQRWKRHSKRNLRKAVLLFLRLFGNGKTGKSRACGITRPVSKKREEVLSSDLVGERVLRERRSWGRNLLNGRVRNLAWIEHHCIASFPCWPPSRSPTHYLGDA
jgi:hypothetical protein